MGKKRTGKGPYFGLFINVTEADVLLIEALQRKLQTDRSAAVLTAVRALASELNAEPDPTASPLGLDRNPPRQGCAQAGSYPP